jgi:hypothetical protein
LDDYTMPDWERIVAAILEDLVDPKQIGTSREKAFDRFENMTTAKRRYKIKDFDYILLHRDAGYLTDSFTDISSVELSFIAKDRSRAMWLAGEATKRILAAPRRSWAGFYVDNAREISGAEQQATRLDDDFEVEKAFELHARVRWA